MNGLINKLKVRQRGIYTVETLTNSPNHTANKILIKTHSSRPQNKHRKYTCYCYILHT